MPPRPAWAIYDKKQVNVSGMRQVIRCVPTSLLAIVFLAGYWLLAQMQLKRIVETKVFIE